jgi:hypothetical protein
MIKNSPFRGYFCCCGTAYARITKMAKIKNKKSGIALPLIVCIIVLVFIVGTAAAAWYLTKPNVPIIKEHDWSGCEGSDGVNDGTLPMC